MVYSLCFGEWLVKSKLDAKNGGSLEAMVRSNRAEHFYRIGDDAFAAPSISPISRAQTLNRDAEHSTDFVELLDLAGLRQVEICSITLADLDLEARGFRCKVFLAGMALRLSGASTVQVDARSRSATTSIPWTFATQAAKGK